MFCIFFFNRSVYHVTANLYLNLFLSRGTDNYVYLSQSVHSGAGRDSEVALTNLDLMQPTGVRVYSILQLYIMSTVNDSRMRSEYHGKYSRPAFHHSEPAKKMVKVACQWLKIKARGAILNQIT